MKKKLTLITLVILAVFTTVVTAQEKKIGTKHYNLDCFSTVKVGSIFDVELVQSDTCYATVECQASLLSLVEINVVDDVLTMKLQNTKQKFKHLKVIVGVANLVQLYTEGASSIHSNTLQVEKLFVKSSTASDVDIKVKATEVMVQASGASSVLIKGETTVFSTEASGASDVDARGLVAQEGMLSSSGASSVVSNISGEHVVVTKGAGDVTNLGAGKMSNVNVVSDGVMDIRYSNPSRNYYSDTVKVSIGNSQFITISDNDTTKVKVFGYQLSVDNDGSDIKIKRVKKNKFNGHWGGFALALNGYMTSDMNMDFAPQDRYLDLNSIKSTSVHVNFYEQNISFSKNQKWGMLTGLGIEWHNYRFSRDVQLEADQDEITGYYMEGAAVRKSKLMVCHLVVPLIFEFQTRSGCSKKSAHVGIGVVGGVRLGSHSKLYYDSLETDYDLEDHRGTVVATAVSPSTNKVKNRDDYHLNPFKLDATFRIGWGVINLWGNVGVLELFKKNQGPELYPWSVGITLVGWSL